MAREKKHTELLKNESEVIDSLLKQNGSASARKEAYDRWKDCPAPTSRDEYWKYTRVAPLLKKTYSISNEAEKFDQRFLRNIDAYNLVFVNGVFSEKDSDVIHENDFICSSIKTAQSSGNKRLSEVLDKNPDGNDYFSLLNSAFHQDGPFIFVGRNKVLDKAVRILHISADKDRLVNIKGGIIAESNSKAVIIETWDNDESSDNFFNSRMDGIVEDNASIEYIRIQSIGEKNSLIHQDFVDQSKDSRFTASTISMDGKLIRNNVNVNLNGEGGECNLNGLYMLRGEEHVDNHTQVIHAVPHCESNELYKGILNEKAKGVFNGKVIVARDAQKTNAFQYNGNILLTDDAQVYSKPELEIYADDVKCSHGATTGQLDEEALFYLESRGIGKENARNLLLKAFAMEVLDKIGNDVVREGINEYISKRYYA